MPITRLLPGLLCLPLLCGAAAAVPEPSPPENPERRGPTAGGRLMWDSSEELDLLGDLWADVPFHLGPRSSLFIAVETRSAIEKTTESLTFLVRDLQYEIDLGWRAPMTWSGERPVSFFLGQRGKAEVDRDGQAFLRYLGMGIESRGYRLAEQHPFCVDCGHVNRWAEWRVAFGPVIDENELEGDFVIRGDARFWPGAHRSKLLSLFRGDIKFDGFLDGGSVKGDLTIGPALELPVTGGRTLSLFAYYLDSNNPLGVGHSSVLVGFDYSEGANATPIDGGAPEIAGILGAGAGGDHRRSGELSLRFGSPRFIGPWYVQLELDVNVLTAEDTADLYYHYFAGLERQVGHYLTGAYFLHRSNHQLAEPNDIVTSLNVLEAGMETREWYRIGPRPLRHAWGTLDWRGRLGYLIDSSFGEDVRWHLRGGLRWTPPVRLGRGTYPFVALWIETGDVERRIYSAGLSLPPAWDLELRYLVDEQLFSTDRDALLVVGRYGF